MKRHSAIRLAVFIGFIGLVTVVVRASDLSSALAPEAVRAQIHDSGLTGLTFFVASFTIGLLVYLPGTLFIVASAYVYGWLMGGTVSLAAAIVAVSVNFLIARSIAGRPLVDIKNPIARRLCEHLDEYPVRNVILLRLFLNAAPWLNHALALAPLGFRDYLIGSAVGMAIPIFVISALSVTLF